MLQCAPASNRRGQAVTPSITTKNSKDLIDKDYEVKIVGARWKGLLPVRALFDSIHQELRTVNRNLNHDALRAPLRMAGNIQKPPESLILAITGVSGKALLQSDRHSSPLNSHLDQIISIRPDYQRPLVSIDLLFKSGALHISGDSTCDYYVDTPRARPRHTRDSPISITDWLLVVSGLSEMLVRIQTIYTTLKH